MTIKDNILWPVCPAPHTGRLPPHLSSPQWRALGPPCPRAPGPASPSAAAELRGQMDPLGSSSSGHAAASRQAAWHSGRTRGQMLCWCDIKAAEHERMDLVVKMHVQHFHSLIPNCNFNLLDAAIHAMHEWKWESSLIFLSSCIKCVPQWRAEG